MFNEYFVVIDLCLLALVTALGVLAVSVRNLLGATMLMSIYSLLMASVWSNMDSMDVAFTEAAVGAGVSTVLLIGALVQVGTQEKPSKTIHWGALAATGAAAAALIYGTLDMPNFGDGNSPANSDPVSIGYIKQDIEKENDYNNHYAVQPHTPTKEHPDYFHGHVPNMVTAVIVSYRGYDTMYETTVIFIAGVSMILFLRRRRTP